MSDLDTPRNEPARRDDQPRPAEAPQPYHRQVSHLTQSPINDVEPEYGTINRYATLEQQRSSQQRRHMGTATSDPSYLPLTEFQKRQERAAGTGAQGADGVDERRQPGARDAGAPGGRAPLHYDRYLQTPTSGKPIFVSRQSRQQKRMKTLLVIFIVLAVILAVVWFFFLR